MLSAMFLSILVASVALRVALILYSDWHDAHSVVKYTDIDYRVFSDAARFLVHPELPGSAFAKGPYGSWLGLGEFVLVPSLARKACTEPMQPVCTGNVQIHAVVGLVVDTERMVAPIVWEIPIRCLRPSEWPADIQPTRVCRHSVVYRLL